MTAAAGAAVVRVGELEVRVPAAEVEIAWTAGASTVGVGTAVAAPSGILRQAARLRSKMTTNSRFRIRLDIGFDSTVYHRQIRRLFSGIRIPFDR
jgi:hypothetical protein